MVNIQSKSQARRVVREAQAEANEQRAQRDRDNVDDMAAFLVARTRLAGVDEWQAERVSQIGLEADRRRDEHRSECAAAVQRIRGRGESVGTIAALANVSEGEVRAFLKAARARGAAPPDDAAQPLGAEAVQHNGSQASAGAAPLEARRAGLDSAGVAVALADRVICHAMCEPTDYRSASLAAICPAMATAAGSVWL
jgi:hypothetical protein